MKILYDITTPIRSNMPVYEGDDPIEFVSVLSIEDSGIANITGINNFTTHFGTHVDPPLHFIENGNDLDQIPLERFCGRARVLEISDDEVITDSELRLHEIQQGDIVLFKTKNTRSQILFKKDFHPNHVYISKRAAEYLAFKEVRLVGIDYLSVDKYGDEEFPAHNTLLKNGVIIMESANLTEVPAGTYYLICLPLRIQGADGAPARAILTEYMEPFVNKHD